MYDALPAWFAPTTHEPAWANVTVEPASVQPPVTESTTGLPEPPPWVVTAQVWPTTGAAGGLDVNVTVCGCCAGGSGVQSIVPRRRE